MGFTEDELEGWGGTEDGAELDDFVCAVPSLPLRNAPPGLPRSRVVVHMVGEQAVPICKATDMKQAARVIADQLCEESA
jgi:hypothetical protein